MRRRRADGRRASTRLLFRLVLLAVLALGVVACNSGTTPEPTPPPNGVVTLHVGLYGPAPERAAFRAVIDDYRAPGVRIELTTWPDREAALPAMLGESVMPDVFMITRQDLVDVQSQRLNQPVDEVLDERGIDFGDGYYRDALEDFSADSRLQCLPYSASPMVIYVNTDLVDFARMRLRGLAAPQPGGTWDFAQFTTAARFATRQGVGSRGVQINPTVRDLAPFIYSGGGTLFDDPFAPTSLTFSDTDSSAALETTLELLRNPQVTLSEQQLAVKSPEEWFADGKLGMIAGYRDLVPTLRQVDGLHFDVMPMPTIDSAATVGEITGLCISRTTTDLAAAADLLVYLQSAPAEGRVARAGYVVPASLEVAQSDDFLQTGQQPAHAEVFSDGVRDIVALPLLPSWADLERAVSPGMRQMISQPVLDLAAVTQRIDQESQSVLGAEPTPSP